MSVKAARYNFSRRVKDVVYAKTGGRCFYCGKKIENEDILDEGGGVVTVRHHWNVDHKIPVSRHGTNAIENLVPACFSCNAEKGTMTDEEFVLWRATR
jgi:5-methylcytosine-specific restriction endonuclease McrA